MKKLFLALLITGLCACASNDSPTKKPTTQAQCDILEGVEREGCLRDVSRMQDRERDRQKKKLMCGARLDC